MLRRITIEDLGPQGELAIDDVPARRAAIIGCQGEVLEQLVLMLELMGWTAECPGPEYLDPQHPDQWVGLAGAPSGSFAQDRSACSHQLLFVDASQAMQTGFAINRSETVVFLGRAPTHGRALYEGKSIIWLQVPLNIVQLERVIMSAG